MADEEDWDGAASPERLGGGRRRPRGRGWTVEELKAEMIDLPMTDSRWAAMAWSRAATLREVARRLRAQAADLDAEADRDERRMRTGATGEGE